MEESRDVFNKNEKSYQKDIYDNLLYYKLNEKRFY